jgi:hypothetical protein
MKFTEALKTWRPSSGTEGREEKARDALQWELSHCYFNENGNRVTQTT